MACFSFRLGVAMWRLGSIGTRVWAIVGCYVFSCFYLAVAGDDMLGLCMLMMVLLLMMLSVPKTPRP